MPKITFSPPGHAPLKYRLDREVVKVGRGADCDAQITFGGVSNHHAELLQIKSGYMVVDQGSTNGIKIDNHLVPSAVLEHGSKFHVGDVEALFELYPEELEIVEAGDDLFPDAPGTHDLKSRRKKSGQGKKKGKGSDDDHDGHPPPPEKPGHPDADKDKAGKDDDDEDDEDSAPPPPPPPPPPPGFLDEDDDDDDFDELAAPESDSPKVTRATDTSREKKVVKGGPGMFVFLCILVTIFALGIGLTIRHYNETGRFLWKDLLQRTERVPAD